ncbi:MAG: hypothetical protein JXJ20_03600 [Anaerolineae bacterium]|nr:hypothetical protein [Anaerolineae bacterium]
MTTVRTHFIAVILIAALAVTAIPAYAQDDNPTRTVTLTEDEINALYFVTNNPNRSVSDMIVDLQPGQVVISATITLRGREPFAAVVTLLPTIREEGYVIWTANSVLVDGEAASDALLAQVNATITASWRRFVKEQFGPHVMADIMITDTEITYTLDLSDYTLPERFYDPETNTVTLTEEQINGSYRVTNTPRQTVGDAYVDLQPGQVVITATITLPRQDPIGTVTILVPDFENERIRWTVASAVVDGEAASEDLLAHIDDAIAASWRNYFRDQLQVGLVTEISVTDDTIVYTLKERPAAG